MGHGPWALRSLEDQMAADNKDLSEQKATKASAEETKATATGDLEENAKLLANSKENLETTGMIPLTVTYQPPAGY